MCGIAGIFQLNKEKVSLSRLKTFTDSLSHRGPDGAGYELLENDSVALGHRRLAILDLSERARQPMAYGDGRYSITYNGEIFNFNEIRKCLEQKGCAFATDSDTEVILAAYATYGPKCLDQFNGMWAFAIWDAVKKELFVARDRFGIKPFYYDHTPGKAFIFASETRAFKYLESYTRLVDDQLLNHLNSDNYSLEGLGYTMFKGIVQLLPSHYMIVRENAPVQQIRWWNIKDHLTKEIPATVEEQAAKFYELFEDACRIRLISDVPLGTALSGGLDSSSIYSVVSKLLAGHKVERSNIDSQRAFTATFPDLPTNEADYAIKAAAYTGGTITQIESDVTDLGRQIEKDTEMADFISSSPITAIAAVYGGMRKAGIVVSMDGHGVDEMMFGYIDMVYNLYNNALWNGSMQETREYYAILHEMYSVKGKGVMSERFKTAISEKEEREGKLIHRLKKVFKKDFMKQQYVPISLPSLSNEPYDFSAFPPAERMLYYEFFQHSLPALLRNFDRAGMMNSIEIRMPFMDWRLVSYVFSLPVSSKIGQGYTKLILREAMKGRLDESIRARTYKIGITSPVEHWFRHHLQHWVMDNINDSSLKETAAGAYRHNALTPQLTRRIWQEINYKIVSRA
jgi:asparagine synthase (glutamine-hydrolysing)